MSKRNRRNRRKQQQQFRNFKIVRDVDVLIAGQSFEDCRVADAVEPPASHKKLEEDGSYGFESECFPFARHRCHFPITRYV
jgi:hypothetical protein